MKKLLLLCLVMAISPSLVMAGGDKVRGDNGQGDVRQVQVQDPPPFQDDELDPDVADFFYLGD